MSNSMVDVTIHIDEMVSRNEREAIGDKLRATDGIMAAVSHDEKPHLMMVEYDPEIINSLAILTSIKDSGVHAELIGL